MKNLIYLIAILFSQLTFSQDEIFSLEADDTFLQTIKEGRLISQGLMCEDFTCFVNGTTAVVELPLGGCLDRLGPVTYSVEQKGNSIVVNMTAIRIANEQSIAAFCIKEPTAHLNLNFPNMYGHVKINMLQAF